jgi:hypothetical protein
MAKEKAKEPEVLEPAGSGQAKHDALALRGQQLPTEININQAREKFIQIQAFQKLVQSQLHEGLDYGVIPGTKKPTLYKAGAEKVVKLLDLADTFEIIEKVEDWEKGFFFYNFRVRLVSLIGGQVVSEGVGSCNSKEEKYRWRWVPADKVPKGIDPKDLESKGCKRTLFEFEFAINKGETTGQYGKPAEYWERWRKAIREHRVKDVEKSTRDKKKMLKGFEIVVDETLYRLPNDDVFSIVNTIEKMGKKRAMVDAALSVGRLSELFTQDLEDREDHEAHEAGASEPSGEEKPKPQEKPKAEEKPKGQVKPPAKPPAPATGPAAGPGQDAAATARVRQTIQDAKSGAEPFVPDDDEPPDEAYEGDEGAQGEGAGAPFPDIKKTDAKAETVKAIQEHLKIAFGKAYDSLYKAFKDWLGTEAGPKLGHNFVGLEHGNWSLNEGDIEGLLFLHENRARAVEGFVRFMDKAKKAQEKGE